MGSRYQFLIYSVLILAFIQQSTWCKEDADGAVLQRAKSIEDWIISIRRQLHQIPELGYELHKTSAFIRQVLDELQITYRYPVADVGIVATIGSGSPVVALRADMDALPVEEPEGLEFVSQHKGKMHACGHDAHMSMLLGAAKLLKQREKDLKGSVRLVFQPAEEGGAGGQKMVEQGAVDGVETIFGLHVWPALPSGTVGSRVGTLTAATNKFVITVNGRGGHGAMPHLNVDPWPAVAHIIMALQTLVSRETNPVQSSVVSIGSIVGGDVFNVVPSSVQINGTMRSLQVGGIKGMEENASRMMTGISEAFRSSSTIATSSHYPPTVNDAEVCTFAFGSAKRLFGDDAVVEVPPSMIGEDFSYYAMKIPATFMLLGIGDATIGSTTNLHSENFVMDESMLHRGAAYHAAFATEYLDKIRKGTSKGEL